MTGKSNRKTPRSGGGTRRAAHPTRKMSTASKVAIASAAGVLAATAAGLATTKTGRRISRNVGKSVSPMVHQHIRSLVDTVESTLADAGVLDMIPPKVRKQVHDRLVGAAASGNGASTRSPKSNQTRRPSSRRGTGGNSSTRGE